jgi:hypothetical protein
VVFGDGFISRGHYSSMAPGQRTLIQSVLSGKISVIGCIFFTYFSKCQCNSSVVGLIHRGLNRREENRENRAFAGGVHWTGISVIYQLEYWFSTKFSDYKVLEKKSINQYRNIIEIGFSSEHLIILS